MYIILISNYKKKLAIFSSILALWVLMFFLSYLFISKGLSFNVTINRYLSFSYPIAYEVDSIYINEEFKDNSIETTSSFKRPQTQLFSSYKSLKGNFSFNYPSAFTITPQDFSGSDILYHIDFSNKQKTSHGFVEVWNLPYSLQEFLDKSKSTSHLNYKYFSSKPVNVNNTQGFYWDYSVLSDNGSYYKGNEIFFKKDNKMYRISYFVPENMWNQDQSDVFWGIVNSFKAF